MSLTPSGVDCFRSPFLFSPFIFHEFQWNGFGGTGWESQENENKFKKEKQVAGIISHRMAITATHFVVGQSPLTDNLLLR